MSHRVIHGDCTVVLRDMAREAFLVDSVVTDPPYHLASIVARLGSPDAAPIQSGATGVYARGSKGFMGQTWDGGDVAFRVETWRRVFDVMKPGAHLVAFSATKGYHRMVCAIEDAGFEIRDMVPWLYGTGFPHSHNLDGDWDGWGTNLKPAIEPVVLAQKPISEASIEANVARWGVGALNIDASRIPISNGDKFDGGGQSRNGVNVATHQEGWRRPWMDDPEAVIAHRDRLRAGVERARELGRWPANVCHDGSEEVLAAFAAYGERGAVAPVHTRGADKFRNTYGTFKGNVDEAGSTFRGDSGTAARFFYSSKATQGEPLSCVFVMLNPSTADGEQDDPTIRRCIAFAKREKFDRLEVVNLFAHRATDPRELLALNHDDDPVGVENERQIAKAIEDAGLIICAWGVHGQHLGQDETALGWIDSHNERGAAVVALGLTKDGHPKHPLYLRADSSLVPFDGRR